jgi:hypothetical protein
MLVLGVLEETQDLVILGVVLVCKVVYYCLYSVVHSLDKVYIIV